MRIASALFLFTVPLLATALISSRQNDLTSNPMNSIVVKVGEKKFTATLLDHASTQALKAMLPLTMRMNELNGNEKYFQLARKLPTDSANPKTINTGDLMLWGSDTIVIFYQTFSTSYSYTRLGKIDDPSGLAASLGSGNVIVTMELK